jgi:4-amino-4-deoxy-L-arabinose transferase-like glycosyltransferase
MVNRGLLRKYSKNIWFCLFVLLVVSGAVRFWGLSSYGLSDSDACSYSSEAKRWDDGNYTNNWSKPGYHLLNLIAVKIIGFHDYSSLYLNSFLDIVNILLIFLIGKRLKMNFFLCLAASCLYSFIPNILYENTRGLVHLASAAFLLFAFLMLLMYLKKDRFKGIYLLLSGLSLGYAGAVHPTLLCMPLFFGLVILMFNLKRPIGNRENVFAVIRLEIFLFFWLLAAGGLVLFMSNGKLARISYVVYEMLKGNFFHHRYATQGSEAGFFNYVRYSFTFLIDTFSIPLLILSCLIIMLFVIRMIFNQKKDSLFTSENLKHLFLVWGTFFSFLSICFLVVNGWAYRLTTPVIPFFILGVVYLADILYKKGKIKYLNGVILCVSIIISGYNVFSSPDLVKKPPTVYRQLANALYGKVNEGNRLLITPSEFYKFPLEGIYFDAVNVYRLKELWKPRVTKLQQHNIRYVMVAKDLNRTVKELNRIYPETREDFEKLEKEYNLIYAGLKDIKAKKLYESSKLSIYEVPMEASQKKVLPDISIDEEPFYKSEQLYEIVDM